MGQGPVCLVADTSTTFSTYTRIVQGYSTFLMQIVQPLVHSFPSALGIIIISLPPRRRSMVDFPSEIPCSLADSDLFQHSKLLWSQDATLSWLHSWWCNCWTEFSEWCHLHLGCWEGIRRWMVCTQYALKTVTHPTLECNFCSAQCGCYNREQFTLLEMRLICRSIVLELNEHLWNCVSMID